MTTQNVMEGKTIRDSVRETALEVLRENPEGVKYSYLLEAVHDRNKGFKKNTIASYIWNLDSVTASVEKPAWGVFRIVGEHVDSETETASSAPSTKRVRENEFYQPFANWLMDDVGDATYAIPLGEKTFTDIWGTPDIIGTKDSNPSDIFRPPMEIVSAEIKVDTQKSELMKGFGQACAYCLFSHRSYLVIPKQANPDDLSRLDSLCQVFGIGFVLFDAESPKNAQFQIRTRPRKQEPYASYANKNIKKIESELFSSRPSQ